jgi:hypothetical protein
MSNVRFEGAPVKSATLYKFRSFDNWKLVLDILVNKRMYAAPFHKLNDPMEGRYYYFGSAVSRGLQRALLHSKSRRNILSLSDAKRDLREAKRNTLLWSYYAGGHTGIAIGIRRPRDAAPSLVVRDVTYDSGVHLDAKAVRRPPEQLALDILTQKQMPWEHEQEVRVFSDENYVRVSIVEIILGCNASPLDELLVRQLAKRWHPRVPVTKLRRSALDEPNAVARER